MHLLVGVVFTSLFTVVVCLDTSHLNYIFTLLKRNNKIQDIVSPTYLANGSTKYDK